MKIILMRHGKPAIGEWGEVKANKVSAWINRYNDSGVMEEFPPDKQSVTKASSCNVVVCSTLTRSLHSAELLGLTPSQSNALFNEADLPVVPIPFIKLKPHTWSMIFRVFWFLGYSQQLESYRKIKVRVSVAACHLIKLAEEKGDILLVGHGGMNRLLAKELRKLGWQGEAAPNGNKYSGYQYWESSEFWLATPK